MSFFPYAPEYVASLEARLHAILVAQNSSSELMQKTTLNSITKPCVLPVETNTRAQAIMQHKFGFFDKKDIFQLSDFELAGNLSSYRQAILEKLNSIYRTSVSLHGVEVVYCSRQQIFSKQDELYKDSRGTLKVSDVLKVAGYALTIAEATFDMKVEKYQQGVLVLKGIDLAFNNEQQDFPGLRRLGYAVELLAEARKLFVQDKQAQKALGIGAAAFNLAIDFFTKSK